jgi:hypothetical protein
MAACDLTRPLTDAQRAAGFDQQRTGVGQALRPFSGSPTVENLIDYCNRELVPVLRATRNAANDVWKQVVDNAPSANPLSYYFSTTTAAADPTAGRIRLNQATQNTATIIRVSESNARLQSVQPWLDVMSGGPTTPLGTVTLLDAINPGRFLRFDLNTMTDQGAYWDLGVTFIEGSDTSPFTDGEAVTLGFIAGVSAAGSTVPAGSLTPVANDTFLGNVSGGVAAPSAVNLSTLAGAGMTFGTHTLNVIAGAGASLVVSANDIQRGALTGEVTATQDSNATTVVRSTNFQTSPWTGSHSFGAGVAVTGANTHAQWSSQQDDFALGAVAVLRGTQAGDQSLTGMVAAFDGQLCIIKSTDSGDTLNLPHASASSAAANQFDNPNDGTVKIAPGGAVLAYKDASLNKWCPLLPHTGAGRLLRVQDLLGTGTYTPAGDCTSFYVEIWGGGGGAGGAVGSVGNSAVGAGGGGGGYCSFYVTTLAASYAYAVAAGGTAGSSSGGDGADGGDTTFDSATSQGGKGGEGSANATRGSGAGTTFAMTGPGGLGGTGNVSVPSGGAVLNFGRGFPGMPGFRQTATIGYGGAGGAAGGGKGPTGGWNLGSSQAGGSGSTASGSGGDGGFSVSATGRAGGAGGSGRIRVWEFS